MDLSTLATKTNLHIAWRRITSGQNTGFKAPLRPILESYELGLAEALADLRLRLLSKAYEPTPPLRLYYPKPSGLQRPISYLVIEDQVVYQALANLFAARVLSRRKPLEGRAIFSNYLNPATSPFAVGQWWIGHAALHSRFELLYRAGFKWVVRFDLAAFYDTVSHDLLMRVIAPKGGSKDFTDQVCKWLSTWTSITSAGRLAHGIPQGPVASDVLAECLLLPVDEAMAAQFRYARYVDDVRIFARSEDELRRAIVQLDRLCRERGLVPHVDKLGATKLTRLSDVRSLAPTVDAYHQTFLGRGMKEPRAWRELQASLNPKHLKVEDKTRLRFALFRSPPSARIVRLILRIWPRFPEHTDAFMSALQQYTNAYPITPVASSIVRSSYPYDAVKGEAWKLLARLSPRWQLRSLLNRAVLTTKDATTEPSTRIGALIFLCRCHALAIGRYGSFLRWAPHPLIQAFAAPFLPVSSGSVAPTIRELFKRTVPDPALAILRSFVLAGIDPRPFLTPGKAFQPVVQAAFEASGIVPPAKKRRRDRIGILLAKRYSVPDWPNWNQLLAAEYAHAQSTLLLADAYFESQPTPWLAHQDAFNEVIFRAFQAHLAKAALPGSIPTVYPSGELIDYGTLIRDAAFRAAFPTLAATLVNVHTRRNRLPSSHPYEKRTGARASPLRRRERAYYINQLHIAYQEVVSASRAFGF
jgi:hypothetical protein